jgi:hypothetical protein
MRTAQPVALGAQLGLQAARAVASGVGGKGPHHRRFDSGPLSRRPLPDLPGIIGARAGPEYRIEPPHRLLVLAGSEVGVDAHGVGWPKMTKAFLKNTHLLRQAFIRRPQRAHLRIVRPLRTTPFGLDVRLLPAIQQLGVDPELARRGARRATFNRQAQGFGLEDRIVFAPFIRWTTDRLLLRSHRRRKVKSLFCPLNRDHLKRGGHGLVFLYRACFLVHGRLSFGVERHTVRLHPHTYVVVLCGSFAVTFPSRTSTYTAVSTNLNQMVPTSPNHTTENLATAPDLVAEFYLADSDAAVLVRQTFGGDELFESKAFTGVEVVALVTAATNTILSKVLRFFVEHRQSFKDAKVRIGPDEISLEGYSMEEIIRFSTTDPIAELLREMKK